MTAVSGPLLAGAQIRIDGQALDPAVQAKMLEGRVEQHLRLPDRASLRLAYPKTALAAHPTGELPDALFDSATPTTAAIPSNRPA